MPNQRVVPTLRRRRLAGVVRQLRITAGLTVSAAAHAMGWDESKMSRVETAKMRLPAADVGPLLALYGVTDSETVTVLEDLARDAGKSGWWQPYAGVVGATYADYMTLEEDATELRAYAPSIIPGLLQTGAYARRIIAATAPSRTPEEVRALAEVRRGRQALLTDVRAGGPLELWAVIGEAALHLQTPGDRALMRDQLRHLLDMAAAPNIVIQVMPLSASPHPGLVGAFEVAHFPPPWPATASLEDLRGNTLLEGGADAAQFEAAHGHIVAAALPVDDSLTLIRTLIERTTA